jgi:hypothetical protein
MKFLKEWSDYNPELNQRVRDFIDTNKTNLLSMWDDEKSEEENMQYLIDYFTEYPDEMNSVVNPDKIKTISSKSGMKNSAPILMNIGGVKDFKSF